MATETQPPDAVLVSTNYTTLNLVDIDEDPDAPDGAWGAWDGSGNTVCSVSFGTPTGNPTVGAGLQEFRVRIRKTASGGSTATWSLQLWGNSVLVRELASGTISSINPGQVASGTWNANELGTADGSLVECRLEQTGGGTGNPSNQRGIEVGAVEWNVTYDAGVTHQLAGLSAAVSAATGSLAVQRPIAGISAAVSSASGSLGVQRPLAGISAGVSGATGALGVKRPLAGVSAGVSTAAGAISVQLSLAGASSAVSTAAGALSLSLALAGASAAVSSASGAVGVRRSVSGTSAGVSSATGDLTIVGETTGGSRRALLII